MTHKIFLTPVNLLPPDAVSLAAAFKHNLLTYLYVRVNDDTLRPSADNKIFYSKHCNWLQWPNPKIVAIDSLGVTHLKYATTDYAISFTDGSVTFGSATTNTIMADYHFFPFSDQQLGGFMMMAIHELSALIYRNIDINNIPNDYKPAIGLRLYTNLLKALILQARDFFSVSVAGRSISKTNIVPQINEIISQNEKQLAEHVHILRTFNKTNRILPTFPSSQTLTSDGLIS